MANCWVLGTSLIEDKASQKLGSGGQQLTRAKSIESRSLIQKKQIDEERWMSEDKLVTSKFTICYIINFLLIQFSLIFYLFTLLKEEVGQLGLILLLCQAMMELSSIERPRVLRAVSSDYLSNWI